MVGGKSGKCKRMRVMMENALVYSDVEFRVGAKGTPVFGLKAIFARASEVFAKMFFEGGFREQAPSQPRVVVVVSDVEVASFEQLRRWVYDMDVDLTYDSVFGVFAAARKYMVEELDVRCRRWIAAAARSPDGALRLWAAAAAGGWSAWADEMLERVECFRPEPLELEVLEPLPFEEVAALLRALMRRPDFCPRGEAQLFEAVRAWADAAPARGERPEAAWQRVLDEDLLQFHLMDSRSLAELVVGPGLLPQERALSAFVDIAMKTGTRRPRCLVGRLRSILWQVGADEAPSQIEALLELCSEDGYALALARTLVERAVLDSDCCPEWASMWSELWGALRAKNMRDDCMKAMVNHCQTLFEEEPEPDSLLGVWRCPADTLGLVRILVSLNHLRRLAVTPLMKVLQVLVERSEEGACAACAPMEAARELLAYLVEISARKGHLTALESLPQLRDRLAQVADLHEQT